MVYYVFLVGILVSVCFVLCSTRFHYYGLFGGRRRGVTTTFTFHWFVVLLWIISLFELLLQFIFLVYNAENIVAKLDIK